MTATTTTVRRAVPLIRVSEIPAPTHALIMTMPDGERREILRMADPGRIQAARWAAEARAFYGAQSAVVMPLATERRRAIPAFVDQWGTDAALA